MIIPVLLINIIIVGYQICQRKTIPLFKQRFLNGTVVGKRFPYIKQVINLVQKLII